MKNVKNKMRSEVGKLGAVARWGEGRPRTRTIRVHETTAARVMALPEIGRTAVVSAAIDEALLAKK